MVLLAKSPRGDRTVTLRDHLFDTQKAAALLFRDGSRWQAAYLRFFKLDAKFASNFLLNLQIAGLFHDIGKANEDFQRAMTHAAYFQQGIRHEHFSALFLTYAPIRGWLEQNTDLDVDCIVAAVLSHHLKAARDGEEYPVLKMKRAGRIALKFDDEQVVEALDRIAELAGLPKLNVVMPKFFDEKGTEWDQTYKQIFISADRFKNAIRTDNARLQFCLALKAGLVAADSAASGLVREQHDICDWIETVAHRPPIAPDGVENDILTPRKKQIGSHFSYHAFQNGAASIGPRGLLLAACGAGKTMAAWRWADSVARERPIGRVIFLYPTRGTATEGFKDYVAHAPEGDAALVHGTSNYELAGMQANPTEQQPVSIKNKTIVQDESQARLFSLGLWDKKYFAATVDQFLSFMENGYGGLCLLPALADSAIIFDEVHSYDATMWNALTTFLARFDVPVLCMTATLPPRRRTEIEKYLRPYPNTSDRKELADLEENERHPRYRIVRTKKDDALAHAIAAYRDRGERVLWVVNTVNRCRELARRLAQLNCNVITYHSRFKLKDRQDRHRETIAAFRAPPNRIPVAAIAVTTQVCEMSLDLDADVLITEQAPISSLVQRFGRANRHRLRGDDFKARVFTYKPETTAPYNSNDLEGVDAFLAAFNNCDVSQFELAEALERFAPPSRAASGASRFVDGGYFALAGSLRDDNDTGCQVVLDNEVVEYLNVAIDKRAGMLLTVPKKFAVPDPRLGKWIQVADSNLYNSSLGFGLDE